jgi:hypothetical protein
MDEREVILSSYTILDFGINLGRAAFGEILMLTWWGATLGRKSDVNIGRAALEACSAT